MCKAFRTLVLLYTRFAHAHEVSTTSVSRSAERGSDLLRSQSWSTAEPGLDPGLSDSERPVIYTLPPLFLPGL